MRRTDREIMDRQELLDVMARCDVCRLALNDESGYPYVVPLNFGMEEPGRYAVSAVPRRDDRNKVRSYGTGPARDV